MKEYCYKICICTDLLQFCYSPYITTVVGNKVNAAVSNSLEVIKTIGYRCKDEGEYRDARSSVLKRDGSGGFPSCYKSSTGTAARLKEI